MNCEVTYCLLADIRERKSNITSLVEVFQELVETLFTSYYPRGKIAGNLDDVRNKFKEIYGLDIPHPTLKIILAQLRKDNPDKFSLYSDYSFQIQGNTFRQPISSISENEKRIGELNQIYSKYCLVKEQTSDCTELYRFIENAKTELLAFVRDSKNFSPDGWDSGIIEFLEFIQKIPKYWETFEKVLMGSIISSYFDIEPELEKNQNRILLLDTNFIVSLMDLQSEDSYITTDTILTIAMKAGYKFQILPETIKEIKNLITRKARFIGRSTNLFSSQRPHTIENGCARRQLTSSDLLLYAKKCEDFLQNRSIEIISEEKNNELSLGIEATEIYKNLSGRPFNKYGIKHDAMAMKYVKALRKKNVHSFAEVNSFFVTDTDGFNENKVSIETSLPYLIRAEELLNILWLSNPICDSSILTTNLSKIMTMHLYKKLPDKKMLSSIDAKIAKYSGLSLNKKDCTDIALNLAHTDSKKLKELLEIEDDNEEGFNSKLQEIAKDTIQKKQAQEKKEAETYEQLLDMIMDESYLVNQKMSELRGTYDNAFAEAEKRHLEEIIKRDEDNLQTLTKQIAKLNGESKKRSFVVFSITAMLLILGLIVISFGYIFPEWEESQVFLFFVSKSVFWIAIVFYILTGKSINVFTARENIANIINRKLIMEINEIRIQMESIEALIAGNKEKISNIIV